MNSKDAEPLRKPLVNVLNHMRAWCSMSLTLSIVGTDVALGCV